MRYDTTKSVRGRFSDVKISSTFLGVSIMVRICFSTLLTTLIFSSSIEFASFLE